jgi:hypothetical protein
MPIVLEATIPDVEEMVEALVLTDRAPMKVARSNYAIYRMGRLVYVFGGLKMATSIDDVE